MRLIVACTLFFVALAGNQAIAQVVTSPNAVTTKSSNASIKFENTSHSFGNIIEGQIARYDFKFVNTGTEPATPPMSMTLPSELRSVRAISPATPADGAAPSSPPARALTAVVPVLRHLLGTEAQALVSDAILARVRGMILDLAAQLLAVQAGHDPATRGLAAAAPSALDPLADALMADEALLAFCHVLAAEGLIAQRLQEAEQAVARQTEKGADAARVAVEMAQLLKQIG